VPSYLDRSEKRTCSLCHSDSFRLINREYGKRSYFALEEVELVEPITSTVRASGRRIIFLAFACANDKCAHVDLYSHAVIPGTD
jgi:hypothetical protein